MGRSLERCRLHFLPQLADRTKALVFGDGDGRFLAALLKQNPNLTAEAIDTSAVMLRLLSERCRRSVPSAALRVQTRHVDALTYLDDPSTPAFDLVVSHFFLDCFTQPQVEDLAVALSGRLGPGALWIVSEFRIPDGRIRYVATFLVRGLYFAFKLLTGLQTDRLPDHTSALTSAGFVRDAYFHSLLGVLTTELWSLPTHAASLI